MRLGHLIGRVPISDVAAEVAAFTCSLHQSVIDVLRYVLVTVDAATVKGDLQRSCFGIVADGTEVR